MRFIAIFFVVMTLGYAGNASAANEPEIIQKRDMKFGEWASDINFPGTVVLSPDADNATGSGGAFSFGGTIRRARFQIIGKKNRDVFITLPSSITIQKGATGNAMTIDNFTMDKSNPITLNNQGKRTINIGATLHISVNQKKGNYNDDNIFTIYADY